MASQIFTAAQVLTAAQMNTLANTIDGYATTATAAGTTTLTVASYYQQFFTGATTQTVVMPVASTLVVGWKIRVVNNSSGIVTVQSSGANTIYAVPAGGDVIFTCILASGTTAASWDYKNHVAVGGSSFVGCRLTKSANQSIPGTSTETALTFDTETYDTSTFHDNVTNNSRITIPTGKAGYYLINILTNWEYYGGQVRSVSLYKNGTVISKNKQGSNSVDRFIGQVQNVLNLAAGDYLEVFCWQNTGTSLSVYSDATDIACTQFSATYIGA